MEVKHKLAVALVVSYLIEGTVLMWTWFNMSTRMVYLVSVINFGLNISISVMSYKWIDSKQ